MANEPKFNVNDVVLVQIRSDLVGRDIWVARIMAVENSSYYVKTISTEAAFLTKIPFLFNKMLTKLESDQISSTIKAVKLLYYE